MPTTSAENSGSGAVAQNGGVAAGKKGIALSNSLNLVLPSSDEQGQKATVPRLLPPLDDCFVGRDKELDVLIEQIQPGKVTAVCGPGGMGKSALAAQAVNALEPGRFPDGIIFHSFYHQPKVETALQALCAAFQVEAKADLESAVRQALSGRKALLILDGTEEADDLPAVLKLRGGCGVLITSRKKADAQGFRLDLKPLDEQPAEAVFRLYSGVAEDDASVAGICEILGGWPVALRIAGRYLRMTGEKAADYLRWLEQAPFKELGDGQHQVENAALMLRRSVAQVSDDARLALGVAGCLAFMPIAREPVAVILEDDERRARNALGELVTYGLLEYTGNHWKLSHALIHAYARTELALSKNNLKRLAQYYIHFCEAQSKAGLEGYVRLNGERAHCLRLMESCLASGLWQEVQALAGGINTYLVRQGYWTEQLTAIDMKLTAARQAGDRNDEGWCLNSLGYTCDRRGEYEKALTYYEQSLPIWRELDDRQGEGATLNNIAEIYWQQGKHELALEQYQQSLSIAREIGDRQGEGTTLNNIGTVYRVQGDYATALPYLEQCLPIAREVGNTIGEGMTLNNMATIYRAQGDLAKALEYYEQALAIYQQLGDRAGEAQTRWNIGVTYVDIGDLTQAEKYIYRAVRLAEIIGHPDLEKYRDGLARVRAARQG